MTTDVLDQLIRRLLDDVDFRAQFDTDPQAACNLARLELAPEMLRAAQVLHLGNDAPLPPRIAAATSSSSGEC